MKKITTIFLYSFGTALLSLIFVFIYPSTILVSGEQIGPSPYRVKLDKLYEKTKTGQAPTASEWNEISILIEKNNQWIENNINSNLPEALNITDLIKTKSDKAGVFIIIIWVFSFYLLVNNKFHNYNIAMLISPILLYFANLYSLFILLLICVSIIFVHILSWHKHNTTTA